MPISGSKAKHLESVLQRLLGEEHVTLRHDNRIQIVWPEETAELVSTILKSEEFLGSKTTIGTIRSKPNAVDLVVDVTQMEVLQRLEAIDATVARAIFSPIEQFSNWQGQEITQLRQEVAQLNAENEAMQATKAQNPATENKADRPFPPSAQQQSKIVKHSRVFFQDKAKALKDMLENVLHIRFSASQYATVRKEFFAKSRGPIATNQQQITTALEDMLGEGFRVKFANHHRLTVVGEDPKAPIPDEKDWPKFAKQIAPLIPEEVRKTSTYISNKRGGRGIGGSDARQDD